MQMNSWIISTCDSMRHARDRALSPPSQSVLPARLTPLLVAFHPYDELSSPPNATTPIGLYALNAIGFP